VVVVFPLVLWSRGKPALSRHVLRWGSGALVALGAFWMTLRLMG
jgi:hypothetical protein